jgi:hypothetical protein
MSEEKNVLLSTIGITLRLNCYLFFANLNKTHVYMVETEDGEIDEESCNLGIAALNELIVLMNQLNKQIALLKENVIIAPEDATFLTRIDNSFRGLIEYASKYLDFLENGGEELYNQIESLRVNLQDEIMEIYSGK